MSLDIGEAFQEGLDRTFARNGLLLAAGFAVVALLLAVIQQTLLIEGTAAMLEWFQGFSPDELGLSQQEYDQQVTSLETQLEMLRESSPLALGVPAGVAAAGLVVVALVGEAVAIVAVRTFGADGAGSVAREDLTGNLLLATLNGFVGKIVVYGLIFLGGLLLLVPGIFFAVAFFFVRQEVALEDKNFVQAMADSWRFTKGHRIAVFALGLVLVIVTVVAETAGGLVGFVSPLVAQVVTAVLGGLAAAFGAAVATRAYVQLDRDSATVDGTAGNGDPYDAALGPDDIPE
jgi:hypothetical protein